MIAFLLLAEATPACVLYAPRRVEIPADAPWRTPGGRVRVVGYNDMREMMEALGSGFARRQPGVSFDFVLRGTRTGPPALTARASAFAPMGAEFTAADLAKWKIARGGAPIIFRIAHDSVNPAALSSPLGIYVNAANPLSRMTMAEVRRRFTVADGTSHPVGLAPDLALALFMRDHVLGGRAFAPGYRGVAKSRNVIDAVAADRQAIGYANISHADPRVRLLQIGESSTGPWHDGSAANIASGRYPLDRHLLIYAARDELGGVAGAFVDFALSCEGQAAVGQGMLGYQPLAARLIVAERRKLPRRQDRQD